MKNFVILILMACILPALVYSASESDMAGVSTLSASLVNQNPDPANAGELVEVRLGLENIGGLTSSNVVVELVPDYPFTLVPGEEAIVKVGAISGYQYGDNKEIVKYTLRVDKDAPAGSYELKVKYYEEGKTVAVQQEMEIDVSSRESAEIIYINRTVLIPGRQSTVEFTINNVGNAPLRNIKFYWENSDNIVLPVGSDNTKYVKYIAIGGSVKLQYQVMAGTDVTPGLYKLDLNLAYEGSATGEVTEISTLAGIYVGGGTDFEVAFSESSGTDVSFSVANIGSNPAYSVSVVVPEQQGWMVTGSSSAIIGNLNNGDYTVATFTLRQVRVVTQTQTPQKRTASSNIALQVAYTDTMGNRNTVDKNVQLSLSSASSNSTAVGAGSSSGFGGRMTQTRNTSFFSTYKWYIAGLVVVIILFVFQRRYRKGKLSNPKFRVKDVFRKA